VLTAQHHNLSHLDLKTAQGKVERFQAVGASGRGNSWTGLTDVLGKGGVSYGGRTPKPVKVKSKFRRVFFTG
jgi:hypothetical protein